MFVTLWNMAAASASASASTEHESCSWYLVHPKKNVTYRIPVTELMSRYFYTLQMLTNDIDDTETRNIVLFESQYKDAAPRHMRNQRLKRYFTSVPKDDKDCILYEMKRFVYLFEGVFRMYHETSRLRNKNQTQAMSDSEFNYHAKQWNTKAIELQSIRRLRLYEWLRPTEDMEELLEQLHIPLRDVRVTRSLDDDKDVDEVSWSTTIAESLLEGSRIEMLGRVTSHIHSVLDEAYAPPGRKFT